MSTPKRSLFWLLIILSLITAPFLAAEEKAVTPTEKPFLWILSSEPPSFLYGTIHIPDDRVLALPEVVSTALEASDVVCTEIPMDMDTQMAAAMAFILPGDENLYDILPTDLYERTAAYFEAKGYSLTMFQKVKVYALVLQLVLLDYLDDLATKQPLDAMLFAWAEEEGKTTDALETVEEQIAIFEAFTVKEQIELLRETLDHLEKSGEQYAEKMIDAYLSGDGDSMWNTMYEYMDPENPLDIKFMRLAFTERNQNMADRIAKRLTENTDKIYFFAIGAGHYHQDKGLLALLHEMGYEATRINAADADKLEEMLSVGAGSGD
jgi:uncharacterized protein YbaP (TraB family)